MSQLLHIITRTDDSLPAEIIALQQTQPDHHTKVINLTKSDPDYTALLEEIFRADSIVVW